jgi:small-conductance mechanosensitive channel
MTENAPLHSRARQVSARAMRQARRARAHVAVLVALIAGVVVAYSNRDSVFGADMPVKAATVVALVILGWAFAVSLGRALWPYLERHLDPGTAGTVGFLIRLLTMLATLLAALRFAGLDPATLAVGGAFTAVILGLAAQQTIGNLIAGTVLISARPYRVGDRIRLHAGSVAGQQEGTVSSLGLLYTTLARGADRIMVPNSVVLAAAIVPLREPSSVELRARLDGDVRPSDVHRRLEENVTVATRSEPHVDLEEFDGEDMVVRITATPVDPADGPALADEVVAVLDEVASRD